MSMLLLALWIAQGDPKSAEQAQRDMEKRIVEAKSLEVEFSWGPLGKHGPAVGDKPQKWLGSRGRLLVMDRFLYYEEFARSGALGDRHEVVVSDGSTVRHAVYLHTVTGPVFLDDEVDVPERAVPADLVENVKVALSRAGSVGVGNIVWNLVGDEDRPCRDARKVYTLGPVAWDADKRQSLRYSLRVVRQPVRDEYGTTLCVVLEPKHGLMAQMIDYNDSFPDIVNDDLFHSFVLNADIPADRFTLPYEKK